MIQKENRLFEDKLIKVQEGYNKLLVNNKRALNSIEFTAPLAESAILRELKGFTGTEKMIETLKEGFNESVRELIFEITALKEYIAEINRELANLVTFSTSNEGKYLQSFINQTSFLENGAEVRKVVRTNLELLKDKLNNRKEIVKEKHEEPEEEPIMAEEEVSELDAMKQKWMSFLNNDEDNY